jgi:integrase
VARETPQSDSKKLMVRALRPGGRSSTSGTRKSRVYRKGRWYHIDQRWRGGGRPVLRDPKAIGWPHAGTTTEDETTAMAWAREYDECWRAEQEEASQRETGKYRSIRRGREVFLRHRDAHSAPSTVSGSRTALTHLIDKVGEDADPAEIDSDTLQELCDEFLNLGYKRGSVANTMYHLSEFFDYVKVKPNPVRKVIVPKPDDPNVEAWNEKDLAQIRRAADEIDAEHGGGVPRRVLVEHLLAVGTRIQETAAARWEDIDPGTRTARVSRQISRASGEPAKTKGRAARSTVVLEEWWDFHRSGASGLIFAGPDGAPVPYRTLYGYVRKILERAGVKRRGEAAHQFRHTYAFLFLERGGSLDQLSKCLGHTRVTTTQKYYDHFTSDHAARAAVNRIYAPKNSVRRGPRNRR